MRTKLLPTLALIVALACSCTTQQMNEFLGSVSSGALTDADVSAGLKQALVKGISTGADQASQPDGYLKNPRIQIPFPEDIQRVEKALRGVGLDQVVDRFVVSLNRAAEDAAVQAKPIFIDAVKSLTFQDVWEILRGPDDAATQYLRRTTSDQLYTTFKPVIGESLVKVDATRYYGDVVDRYNRLPLVKKVNADLADYATNKAIDGLFVLIKQEEARIREDPVARTTELLRRVFAAQDPSE